MSKIRKIIYRNKMKLMENRHSTKGVYCHGAKKNKIVYETNAKALRAVMLCSYLLLSLLCRISYNLKT